MLTVKRIQTLQIASGVGISFMTKPGVMVYLPPTHIPPPPTNPTPSKGKILLLYPGYVLPAIYLFTS